MHKCNGVVFMAFSDVPNSVFRPARLDEFVPEVMNCLQQMHVDHKIYIESLLLWNGTKYEWQGMDIIAYFANEKPLMISFEQIDKFLRVKGIKTIQ